MRNLNLAAAAAVSLALVCPAQAQETTLTGGQTELYAEMLAMSDVCNNMTVFRVREEQLLDWMNASLAAASDQQLDTVLALRDSKLATILADADRVRSMSQGPGRLEAGDAHHAGLVGRCRRLAADDVAKDYFFRR